MADEADMAQNQIEAAERALLARRKPVKTMPPTGICYNCAQDVSGARLFCDCHCEEDFNWALSRRNNDGN